MSATAVAVLLMLALVVDYMSIGPNSVRDRIAFLIALPAIRVGFGGGPLQKWTVGQLSGLIEALKHSAGGTYVAGVTTEVVIGAFVGILAVYTVGVLLPANKWAAGKFGDFSKFTFGKSAPKRLNGKLWASAILLGTLADLPAGFVGGLLRGAINFLTAVVAMLPNLLFGVR